MRTNSSITYIYKIVNTINKKVYIGQAANVHKRFKTHLKESKNKDSTKLLHKAFKKYGEENFIIEIIDKADNFINKETKNYKEIYWISYYKSFGEDGEHFDTKFGYNMTKGGESSFGLKWGNDSRKKLSITMKTHLLTHEHPRGMKNKHHTLDTINQIKNTLTGQKRVDTSNYKGNPSRKGQKDSESTRLKKSISHTGLKQSRESIEKRASKLRGIKKSSEQIQKMILSLKGKFEGEKNPMYGSTFEWFTNGEENRRCTNINKEELLRSGFYKGKIRRNKTNIEDNQEEVEVK